MKITQLEFRTVCVPFTSAIQEFWGWTYPTTLIWVHTDAGITGIGESNSLRSNITDRKEELEKAYVGKDVYTLDVEQESFDIQCALYDIMGQALGVPVHKLIGKKVRDTVELAFWSPPMPPAEMAKEAERARGMGFRVHKIKAHRPRDTKEIVQRITDVCGSEFLLRLDPNTQFHDLPAALRIARSLEGYNIEVYEDPFLFEDMSDYRQFRAKIDVPVARHLGSPREAFLWLKGEAMDMFNCGGNVAGMKTFDALARAAGVPMWGQMFAFGSCIASMFAVHIAATLPACTMALDELPHIRVDDLSGGAFEIRDGAVTVPDKPGLGIALDMRAVEKYRIR
jgi:L-alanine-DL-glutamate epimerase-like enolase superfamily enzyme